MFVYMVGFGGGRRSVYIYIFIVYGQLKRANNIKWAALLTALHKYGHLFLFLSGVHPGAWMKSVQCACYIVYICKRMCAIFCRHTHTYV